MDWNTVVGDFCETKLLGHPEVYNSLSCVFISLFPYLGLKYSYLKSNIIKSILTLLFINGFASFGFHWTGYYFFKHLDEVPMIICIWLGLLYGSSYLELSLVNYFLLNLYFTLILAMNNIPKLSFLFPVTFGIACLLLIPLQKKFFEMKPINKLSKRLMISGSFISIFSAIIWIITENMCRYELLFGHPLWHFGMPLGMYFIMIGFEYHNIKITENKARITWLYNLLPIINL